MFRHDINEKVTNSVERKISLMNAKLFLKNNMLWCTAYDCSNSSENNPGKIFFILPKNECTRKAWIAAINQKEGTLRSF